MAEETTPDRPPTPAPSAHPLPADLLLADLIEAKGTFRAEIDHLSRQIPDLKQEIASVRSEVADLRDETKAHLKAQDDKAEQHAHDLKTLITQGQDANTALLSELSAFKVATVRQREREREQRRLHARQREARLATALDLGGRVVVLVILGVTGQIISTIHLSATPKTTALVVLGILGALFAIVTAWHYLHLRYGHETALDEETDQELLDVEAEED